MTEPFEEVDEPSGIEAETVGGPEPASDSPFDRLFDGNAEGPRVQELQNNYNADWHWATALRGLCRVGTGSGIPPIVEIAIGGGAGIYQLQQGSGDSLDGGSGQKEAEGQPEGPPPHMQ